MFILSFFKYVKYSFLHFLYQLFPFLFPIAIYTDVDGVLAIDFKADPKNNRNYAPSKEHLERLVRLAKRTRAKAIYLTTAWTKEKFEEALRYRGVTLPCPLYELNDTPGKRSQLVINHSSKNFFRPIFLNDDSDHCPRSTAIDARAGLIMTSMYRGGFNEKAYLIALDLAGIKPNKQEIKLFDIERENERKEHERFFRH